MLERFTQKARQVVAGAREHALAATASEVRPEHLMRALLDDETALAVRVLADLGAPAPSLRLVLDRQRSKYVDGLDDDDADALRVLGIDLDDVVRRIDRNLGGLRASRRGRMTFSRSAKKVLELSLREAVRLDHGYIGTEHLLLGLVRSGDRIVAETLRASGVFDEELLREAVAEATRRTG